MRALLYVVAWDDDGLDLGWAREGGCRRGACLLKVGPHLPITPSLGQGQRALSISVGWEYAREIYANSLCKGSVSTFTTRSSVFPSSAKNACKTAKSRRR
jgi:hypothetical protein